MYGLSPAGFKKEGFHNAQVKEMNGGITI